MPGMPGTPGGPVKPHLPTGTSMTRSDMFNGSQPHSMVDWLFGGVWPHVVSAQPPTSLMNSRTERVPRMLLNREIHKILECVRHSLCSFSVRSMWLLIVMIGGSESGLLLSSIKLNISSLPFCPALTLPIFTGVGQLARSIGNSHPKTSSFRNFSTVHNLDVRQLLGLVAILQVNVKPNVLVALAFRGDDQQLLRTVTLVSRIDTVFLVTEQGGALLQHETQIRSCTGVQSAFEKSAWYGV